MRCCYRQLRALGAVALAGVLAGSFTRFAAGQAARPSQHSTAAQIDRGVRRGIAYLRSKQETDGSWQRYPGVTAVCVLALLRNGVGANDPTVARAVRYLAGLAKPDGSICTDAFGPAQRLPNYNTALALTALHAADPAAHAAIIRKAQQFLARSQYDEEEGFRPASHQYGGIGYGSREDNPDLSNLQNALEALRETGYPKESEVFKKALIFIQRCQNRSESNDQSWAGNDGGFVYAASGESKADGRHSSYGSMTYAGIKSYLYCSVTRSDPRVQSAYNWIRSRYTVKENPSMGLAGLYYYYHTMAKTLALWGDAVVLDAQGRRHRWAVDLATEILRLQSAGGAWKNSNPRWWEDRPELVTGYALLTLAECRKGL